MNEIIKKLKKDLVKAWIENITLKYYVECLEKRILELENNPSTREKKR